MIVALVGTGVLLTFTTRGIQFRRFPFAIRQVLAGLGSKAQGEGTVTPFQALSTSLAATVGVGNIAAGGPGALFWLFVSGVFGMATKFSEIAISLNYRERDASGTMRGGPMYVLARGMRLPWLGAIFAGLTALAGFGIGNMVQANSVADVAASSFGVPPFVSGIALAAATALVVLGGIKRIAEVAQVLVPGMCALYLAAALYVLVTHLGELPSVIQLVLPSAFNGQAALGGFAGATVRNAVQLGIARGLFSNEAGLGSAPIVHASAVTDHPVRQAMYGIFGVFVDTLVVCMLTGFVVLSTGVWTSGATGASLSAQAFQTGLPGEWGDSLVSIAIILFRVLNRRRLGLLRRDRDYIFVRNQSSVTLPPSLGWIRISRCRRQPAVHLEPLRHAQRLNGRSKSGRYPRLTCSIEETYQRILLERSFIGTIKPYARSRTSRRPRDETRPSNSNRKQAPAACLRQTDDLLPDSGSSQCGN